MPLNRCGSVRARLSVWFRCRRVDSNASSVAERISRPPGSCVAESGFSLQAGGARPVAWSRLPSGAACLGQSRTPPGCSSPRAWHLAASSEADRRSSGASTSQSSSSSPMAIRFPTRRSSRTVLPLTASSGGSNVRSTNGLLTRTPSSCLPDDAPVEGLDVDRDVGSSGMEWASTS